MKFCIRLISAAFLLVSSCLSANADSNKLGLHTVVIDPGHGGKDPGCVSADRKSQEKIFVLDISRILKKKIEDYYEDVEVKMTRSGDKFVPLIDRARFATRNNANFFISIHINAQPHGRHNANGYSVHILGPSEDKNKDTYAFNMDVCRRENEVIFLEDDYSTNYQGLDPNDPESEIFLRLMHTAYREQSILFAQQIDEKLKESGIFRCGNGIMQNNFAVLRLATMPAVLLELGFISNPTDLATLRHKDTPEKLADALFNAFKEYKVLYDASVGVTAAKPAKEAKTKESPEAAAEPLKEAQEKTTAGPAKEEQKSGKNPESGEVKKGSEQEAAAADAPIYGTQIFAVSRTFSKNDKVFMGFEPKIISSGNLKKYVIGISSEESVARENFKKIKSKYPDSFLVRIENGAIERLK